MSFETIPSDLITDMPSGELWKNWISARHTMCTSIGDSFNDDDYQEPTDDMIQSAEDFFLFMEHQRVIPPSYVYQTYGGGIMLEWVLSGSSRVTAFIYKPNNVMMVHIKDGAEVFTSSWSWMPFRESMDRILEKNRELYDRLSK